jgi:hypothetical protein
MKTLSSSVSLKSELEELIQVNECGGRITCSGKTTKGGQCQKALSKATHASLAIIFKTIVEHLEEADYDELKTPLEDASLLAMCSYHKSQATAKFKQWSDRIPESISKLAQGGGVVDVSSSTLKHIAHLYKFEPQLTFIS